MGQQKSHLLPLSRARWNASDAGGRSRRRRLSSNRALVEVVVENCKMATATPVAPAAVSYTAAVSVNGAAVATVGSTNAPGGTHQAFRAWYASGRVGGIPASMSRRHRIDEAIRCFSRRGSRAAAWRDTHRMRIGRGASAGIRLDTGAGGDAAEIGPLPKWEVQYLQTGDNQARRAVIARHCQC